MKLNYLFFIDVTIITNPIDIIKIIHDMFTMLLYHEKVLNSYSFMESKMKKKLLKIVIGAGIILGVAGVSGATLIAQNGIVADDRGTVSESDDSYWIQDVYSFSGQTYEEQITSINVLNEPGEIPDGPWEDWHMAEHSEMAALIETYNTQEIVSAFGTTEYYIQGVKFADVLAGRYDEEVSSATNYTT